MQNYVYGDQHFAGRFLVFGEEIPGELIFNGDNGVIQINLVKKLNDPTQSKPYRKLDIITGVLNCGALVTLFNNRCIKNTTRILHSQELAFVAEYYIWSNRDATNAKYNKYVCELENALEWSGLSAIDTADFSTIKFKDNADKKVYRWFDANITFLASVDCELFNRPRKEESKVIEHLIVQIETDEKRDVSSFIGIRNRIITLISFAIKDNVNIEEQYLYDYDDYYQYGDYTEFNKHYLFTSEHRLPIRSNKRWWDCNFSLEQLSPERNIQKELDVLEPIFNLYLSLFKYKDMPTEMVFLNIVQALETFHARFFYDNNKDKYMESVKQRFENFANYPNIEKLLLNDTQKDKNTRYIILVSRLNDLLIGKYNGLFWNYYGSNPEFAQTVSDTRNYYTHYGDTKKDKALKGDALFDAVVILSLLLEYNVCLQLGIDNEQRVRERLSEIASWKQVQEYYQKENKQRSNDDN